jgi:hypothetical protein
MAGITAVVCALVFASCGSLSRSASRNDINGMKYFIEDKKADINQLDSYGWTALMTATYYQYEDAVKYLIDKGADLNKQSTYDYGRLRAGSTALIIASYYGKSEIVRMLVRYGANKGLKDVSGYTALDIAERFKFDEIVSILTGRTPIRVQPAADENIIVMNDGTKIVGKIIAQDKSQVTIKSKYTTITIDKEKIAEIRYK